MTYNETLKKYVPSCHVLMTHKTAIAYEIVFSLLKTIAATQNYVLDPTNAMMDFE